MAKSTWILWVNCQATRRPLRPHRLAPARSAHDTLVKTDRRLTDVVVPRLARPAKDDLALLYR